MSERRSMRAPSALRIALLASALLWIARLYAAERLGFGDSEALYACYARHPQAVYLDHPGLIGVFARLVGARDAPAPVAAHHVTALLATLAPWMGALAARAAGASWAASAMAALALMAAPEISVGLFGMTPDLLLVLLWYAALAASAAALRARPGSRSALSWALASGFAAGLAGDAKASGVLLLLGLVLGWSSRAARPQLRTIAPWAGLALALLVASPVALDEVARGFPMLRHRLVDAPVGFSARNVAALALGQLVYVGPVLLWGAVLIARDLWHRRADDAVSALLFGTTVASLPLVVLACFSRVAEPHWVAPIYLALALHFARSADRPSPIVSPALGRSALATGALLVALVHVDVLTPLAPRFLGSWYVPRYDLANDLYAWQKGLPLVRRALAESVGSDDAPPPIVIGPHWTVCAQVHAGLPASVLVGCDGTEPADFADWLPQETWNNAPVVLYVTDDRFDGTEPRLPQRRYDEEWHTTIIRGGRVVRRIAVVRLLRTATAAR